MATFADNTGHEWAVGFTLADLPRLQAAGIDLRAAARSADALADLLFGDVGRLGRVAWTVCEQQAVALGLSPEAFARRFDGPALERLGEAVAEAAADLLFRTKVAAGIKNQAKAHLAAVGRR